VGLGQVGRAVGLFTVTNIEASSCWRCSSDGPLGAAAGGACQYSAYRNLGLGLAILIQGGAFGVEAAE
jgi:hypothetical protein